MGTGGDDRLLRTHRAVEEYMHEENRQRAGRNEAPLSYAKASKQLFAQEKGKHYADLGNNGLKGRIRDFADSLGIKEGDTAKMEEATQKFWDRIEDRLTKDFGYFV